MRDLFEKVMRLFFVGSRHTNRGAGYVFGHVFVSVVADIVVAADT